MTTEIASAILALLFMVVWGLMCVKVYRDDGDVVNAVLLGMLFVMGIFAVVAVLLVCILTIAIGVLS